ncbi:MAG: exopolysaccharide biosynthesis protein exod [Agrobacterium sp. SCN 61-19]|nr:MAG: exopolysaccharide biosynthesis protein exod [Agrobacterium sp. SCN 61-19]
MTDRAETWVAGLATAREHNAPENLSDLLVRLARTTDRKVTIRDIAIALQDRSFGAFLLVFALPNLVPMPPGATFILGLPLIFVAWQMMASPGGRVFFPRVVSDYGVEPQTFEAIVKRLVPWMRWTEKLVVPRFWLFESRFAERLIGVFALILAIVVFLPIPLGNWPPAFALAVLGFAHSQRDGLGVIAGCLIGVLSLAVAAFVVYTAIAVVSLVI